MKKHAKDHVLRVGENLFRTQGYHNTGTEDILKKSEYPRSSFYHHFKSKEGFAVQVLKQYGHHSLRFYQSIFQDPKISSPMKRLRTFANTLIDLAVKQQFKSECLIQKISVECASINPMLRECANTQLDNAMEVLAQCISEGQKIGEIRKNASAIELAQSYQAQFYGSYILARLQNDGSVLKKNMNIIIDDMKVK